MSMVYSLGFSQEQVNFSWVVNKALPYTLHTYMYIVCASNI